ncbi:hypothetical protein [Selenomonas ruminantium]|uniref:hypothetical protein n=1 Tax=Selenomonas ruminantium TaxID=971 RepID=UPI0026E9CE2E|nr:hypothetical protein [Selenomonas ruminantium]
MLTTEILKANAGLAGLTEAQLGIITELSKNDEAQVIGTRIGEIYSGLDADILGASGIAKEGTEKTYDYAKRVIGAMKEKSAGYDAEVAKVTALEAEKARLEGIIAKGGGDEETKKQLGQARADLAAVQKSYTELQSRYETEKTAHEKALFEAKTAGEFSAAVTGFNFKPEITPAVQKLLLDQVVAKVKGMDPEFIDDGKGGKVLAFKEGGVVKRNPNNGLNPFTARELVEAELKGMGILAEGRKQTGTGTEERHETGNFAVDIAGARTQTEAYDIIAKQLMAEGKAKGTKEFEEAMTEAWKTHNVKALPVK